MKKIFNWELSYWIGLIIFAIIASIILHYMNLPSIILCIIGFLLGIIYGITFFKIQDYLNSK